MENTNNDNVLKIERIFDAPRELVWKAWSDPELYKKWWGPKIFTAPVIKIDFRVGGKFLGCMRGIAGDFSGKDFWSTGTYKEIVPMEKIVVTDSFSDEKGNIVSSEHYGMKGMPLEMLVTVTFEEMPDGKTKMTLKHEGIKDIPDEHRKGMDQGWKESFDKLAEHVLKS